MEDRQNSKPSKKRRGKAATEDFLKVEGNRENVLGWIEKLQPVSSDIIERIAILLANNNENSMDDIEFTSIIGRVNISEKPDKVLFPIDKIDTILFLLQLSHRTTSEADPMPSIRRTFQNRADLLESAIYVWFGLIDLEKNPEDLFDGVFPKEIKLLLILTDFDGFLRKRKNITQERVIEVFNNNKKGGITERIIHPIDFDNWTRKERIKNLSK